MSLIEQLIVKQNFEHNVVQVTNSKIILRCNVYLSDPDHPTQPQKVFKLISIESNQTVKELIKKVKSELKNYSFGEDTYIKHQHRLYKEGYLNEINITNNETIEVISLEAEKEATKNEGFIFAFWSLVPLMVAISFIVPALIGTFDIVYRGLFMLAGTLIGLPASIFFIIGITETLTVEMRISFVNYTWFGPCCDCSCCNCCDCCHCSECCCDCNQDNVDEDYRKNDKSKKNNHEDENRNLIDTNQENLDANDAI